MVDWECGRCGLRASDLPDGIDTDECYEVMYGNEYCGGCMQGYEEGIWMLEQEEWDESWGWEDDEDDEDESV